MAVGGIINHYTACSRYRVTTEASIQIFDTNKLEAPKGSVLYIGREKSGKTFSACSWPSPAVICFCHNPETIFKFDVQVIFPGRTKANPEPTISQKLDAWRFNILPAIKNRKLSELCGKKIETIVVDDLTQLALSYKMKLMGAGKEAIPKTVAKMDFDSWNLYLMWLQSDVSLLTEATKPDLTGNRESYNIICVAHERDTTDDNGAIIKISPAVDGQMKDILPSMFGSVLWCDVEKEKDKNGKVTGQRYYCHTISPDKYRRAGDGFGGGRFALLPPKISGTYPELAKAWGIQET